LKFARREFDIVRGCDSCQKRKVPCVCSSILIAYLRLPYALDTIIMLRI
jgi:hypothetical protein